MIRLFLKCTPFVFEERSLVHSFWYTTKIYILLFPVCIMIFPFLFCTLSLFKETSTTRKKLKNKDTIVWIQFTLTNTLWVRKKREYTTRQSYSVIHFRFCKNTTVYLTCLLTEFGTSVYIYLKMKCWLNRADTAPVTICRDTCVRSKALHAFLLLLFLLWRLLYIDIFILYHLVFFCQIILLVIKILDLVLVYFRLKKQKKVDAHKNK